MPAASTNFECRTAERPFLIVYSSTIFSNAKKIILLLGSMVIALLRRKKETGVQAQTWLLELPEDSAIESMTLFLMVPVIGNVFRRIGSKTLTTVPLERTREHEVLGRRPDGVCKIIATRYAKPFPLWLYKTFLDLAWSYSRSAEHFGRYGKRSCDHCAFNCTINSKLIFFSPIMLKLYHWKSMSTVCISLLCRIFHQIWT